MTALLEALGIHNRAGVEAFIQRLVDLLDAMDPDPDLEDDELEAVNEDGGDICDEPHDWNEAELDHGEYDGVQWSNNPDIPQEGWDWHGFVPGNQANRNSPTQSA